jgi:hypothetical protein
MQTPHIKETLPLTDLHNDSQNHSINNILTNQNSYSNTTTSQSDSNNQQKHNQSNYSENLTIRDLFPPQIPGNNDLSMSIDLNFPIPEDIEMGNTISSYTY